MNFSDALNRLKEAHFLTRKTWKGRNIFISLRQSHENSFITSPYLYIGIDAVTRIPWEPSQSDLFAEDWELFE